MKLNELGKEMRNYNSLVAYGSECNAWGHFVNDCYEHYGCHPDDDEAYDVVVSDEFCDYWMRVTVDNNNDYDADGNYLG